jgi:hypothetical protein
VSRERLSPIPNGLLEVDVVAYPIATEAAFTLGITSLDPALDSVTGQLWRAAEVDLLRTFTGITVEHVTTVRDLEWFGAPGGQTRPLSIWFRDLAGRYLERRGPDFAPRRRPAANADLRWIARVLPPDLLAAGLWQGADRPSWLVDSPPPTTLHLREAGFAETHLHIGAGLEFGSHWISTLFTLLDPRADLARFQSPGGAFMDGSQLADWLLRAAIARQFLGEHLATRRAGGKAGFEPFVTGRLKAEVVPLGLRVILPLRAAVRDVMRGRLDTTHDLKTTRWAFRRYCHAVTGYAAGAASNFSHLDPLEPYFPAQAPAGVSTELLFAAAALREMEQTGDADNDFALAFWQTTRLRNIYYRHLTQRALTPGLAWFVRYFDRIGAGRQVTPLRELVQVAAEVSGAGRGLHYFEFRTSPPVQVDAGRSYIEDVFSALPRARGLKEAALVYHFIRAAGGGKTKGLPHAHGRDTHGNPAPGKVNPRGYRYQSYAAGLRRQALVVARLLACHPHLLVQLRAIDLCTDELAVPVWAFVGSFRALRAVGERVSTYLAQYGRNVPPLRRTVHAGEDYPHLLTGLRLVGDTVRRLDLQPGDRLGHALALGFDPDRWAQTTGAAVLPLDVRLFDLAWEWDCRTGPRGVGLDATRAGYLERELRSLSGELFGRGLSPQEVSQLADDLHDPETLKLAGYPNGPRPKTATRRIKRVVRYLREPALFIAGSKPVVVDAAAEARAVEELQTWLRGEVAGRGLAVEINPTSNFLIGNLGEWPRHPLFRMNPPEGGGVNPVPLVVGSDDPLVFATGLPDEYSALERALADAGVPKPAAHRWLDEVRATGVKFRFTLPNSIEPIDPLPADDGLLEDIRGLFV